MKYFIYTVISVVSVAILAGFFIVGSPNEQRLRRFDEQRVSDLRSIQYNVATYWQAKQRLPNALADLNDPLRGVTIPVDPETSNAYEVHATGEVQFELCSLFNRIGNSEGGSFISVPVGGGAPLSDDWKHDAGRVCFSRTIDKDFYQPFSKQ
ncbi:MAG: hypothetical protein NTZ36_00075 [Candidatus Jorgensenbacteria bacterium]|nr:hypothetical protein [Candidatus Jorgensenbacteria bacterium]